MGAMSETAADERPVPGAAGGATAVASRHGDHATFQALSGFFTGLVYVALVPALFAALLSAVFDERIAHEAFPFVGLFLVPPVVLLAWPRTRRFGLYLLIGMVLTAVVVLGVAWLVTWLMLRHGGGA